VIFKEAIGVTWRIVRPLQLFELHIFKNLR